jgi:alpha-beta hydrolase superfamily lysophospholipase
MKETVETITTIDGREFALHIFSPTESPSQSSEKEGVVLALHGLGEHVQRYHLLAEVSCKQNKTFAIFNMRGHGQEDGIPGDVENFPSLILDVVAAFFALKKKYKHVSPQSFGLFGHSLGGLMCTYASSVLGDLISHIYLSAPGYASKDKIPFWKIQLAQYLGQYVPTLSLPIGFDCSKISNNPTNNKAYETDPLVIKNVTTRFGKVILAALDKKNIKNAFTNITAEITMLLPGDDKVVDSNYTKEILKSVANPVHLFELDGAGHEAFNETKPLQEIAISHYENWLKKL